MSVYDPHGLRARGQWMPKAGPIYQAATTAERLRRQIDQRFGARVTASSRPWETSRAGAVAGLNCAGWDRSNPWQMTLLEPFAEALADFTLVGADRATAAVCTGVFRTPPADAPDRRGAHAGHRRRRSRLVIPIEWELHHIMIVTDCGIAATVFRAGPDSHCFERPFR